MKQYSVSASCLTVKDPFESWHYSCVGTFNTKDEAIDYYHKLKEEEKMISRMHMKLIITE